MNWLDILLVLLIVIRAFFGWKRGFVGAMVSLGGVAIAVLLASNFYKPLSKELSFMPSEGLSNILAFVVILSCVDVVATLLARVLKFATSLIKLGLVNKIGGAVFGFLTGATEWAALLAAWVKFFGAGLVTESIVAKVLLYQVPLISLLLPGEFDIIHSFFQ